MRCQRQLGVNNRGYILRIVKQPKTLYMTCYISLMLSRQIFKISSIRFTEEFHRIGRVQGYCKGSRDYFRELRT